MNTPELKTRRLILRKFTKNDLEAIFRMYSDKAVNTFLPWFPLCSRKEAELFYAERYESRYKQACGYDYAVCLKKDNCPIGYINVSMDESYDLGYGLCREFWGNGIVTEAGQAVITQLEKDHIPYITATQDVNNVRSGNVMKRLGMQYQYSYEERWQPKDIPVTFRLYQRNLDGNDSRIYQKYWAHSAVHFIETE